MSAEVISVNVGGSIYMTTLSTLCVYPDSMLGAMFSDTMPTTCDANGCYFIDRDGPMFRIVLNFLRCNKLILPPGFNQYEQLEAEADFYQILPLLAAVREVPKKCQTDLAYSFEVTTTTSLGYVSGNKITATILQTHKDIAAKLGPNWTFISDVNNKNNYFIKSYRALELREFGSGRSWCAIHDILNNNNAKPISSDVTIIPKAEHEKSDTKIRTERWVIPYPLKWYPQ